MFEDIFASRSGGRPSVSELAIRTASHKICSMLGHLKCKTFDVIHKLESTPKCIRLATETAVESEMAAVEYFVLGGSSMRNGNSLTH